MTEAELNEMAEAFAYHDFSKKEIRQSIAAREHEMKVLHTMLSLSQEDMLRLCMARCDVQIRQAEARAAEWRENRAAWQARLDKGPAGSGT